MNIIHNLTQEDFYQRVRSFLLDESNFTDFEEPYWVSRRYSKHYQPTTEEANSIVPNNHVAIFAHPGNSEGWILSVSLAPDFGQLVAAKYFNKHSCLEAVRALTIAFYAHD